MGFDRKSRIPRTSGHENLSNWCFPSVRGVAMNMRATIASRCVWRLSASLVCLFIGLANMQLKASGQSAGLSQAQSCLEAAAKALGPEAVVLKCGHLSGTDALETAAAVRLKQFRSTADGIPVSRLVVLRKDNSEWCVELAVDGQSMRNDSGYIEELSSISGTFIGYRASFSDRGSDDADEVGFTIWLYFLHVGGRNEGLPLQISWNRSAGRFQEFAYDDDPKQFKPEIKNPPRPSELQKREKRCQVPFLRCAGRRETAETVPDTVSFPFPSDGTRVVIDTHQDALGTHMNFRNLLTGGNLHVRW